jgi:hypothetical protein
MKAEFRRPRRNLPPTQSDDGCETGFVIFDPAQPLNSNRQLAVVARALCLLRKRCRCRVQRDSATTSYGFAFSPAEIGWYHLVTQVASDHQRAKYRSHP